MSKRADKFIGKHFGFLQIKSGKEFDELSNLLEQFHQECMPTQEEFNKHIEKIYFPNTPEDHSRAIYWGAYDWCKNFVREEYKSVCPICNHRYDDPNILHNQMGGLCSFKYNPQESKTVRDMTEKWKKEIDKLDDITDYLASRGIPKKDRYIVAITYVMMSSDGTPFDIDSPILSDIEIPILSVNIKHKFRQAKQYVILREEWAEDMSRAMDQAKNKLTEGIHNKIEVISVSALKL